MIEVIDDFGFASLGFKKEDFKNPGMVFQFGREPKRIDLMVDMSEMDFEACYERKIVIELNGVQTSVLGFEDLTEAKRRAGRPKDLGDIDELNKMKEEEKKVKEGTVVLPLTKKIRR